MRVFPVFLAFLALAAAGCALPKDLRERLDDDLRFMESIRGDGASLQHRRVFGDGPVDGNRYGRFFRERIAAVRREGVLYASCDGAFTCYSGGGVARLSDDYARLPAPQIVRVSFLLHEARHAEGYPHEECPEPFLDSHGGEIRTAYGGQKLSGKPACDTLVDGAYGTQIVFLKNIEKHCTSCEKSVRGEAGEFADQLLLQILPAKTKADLQADAEKEK